MPLAGFAGNRFAIAAGAFRGLMWTIVFALIARLSAQATVSAAKSGGIQLGVNIAILVVDLVSTWAIYLFVTRLVGLSTHPQWWLRSASGSAWALAHFVSVLAVALSIFVILFAPSLAVCTIIVAGLITCVAGFLASLRVAQMSGMVGIVCASAELRGRARRVIACLWFTLWGALALLLLALVAAATMAPVVLIVAALGMLVIAIACLYLLVITLMMLHASAQELELADRMGRY